MVANLILWTLRSRDFKSDGILQFVWKVRFRDCSTGHQGTIYCLCVHDGHNFTGFSVKMCRLAETIRCPGCLIRRRINCSKSVWHDIRLPQKANFCLAVCVVTLKSQGLTLNAFALFTKEFIQSEAFCLLYVAITRAKLLTDRSICWDVLENWSNPLVFENYKIQSMVKRTAE